MGRFFKYLLIAAAALIGLLIVLIVAVAFLFDPNDYKDEISARVEAATGRTLTLEGDLELGLFPWLSVDTGRVRLGNRQGFGAEPFAELESASVAIRLWPLLRREIEAGRISIDGLRLNLTVAADGSTNWEDLIAEEEEAGPGAEAESGAGIGELRVAGFSLTDAAVDYEDRAAGSHYRLTGVGLTSGAIEPGEPVDVDARFTLETLPEGPAGTFALVTVLTTDLEHSLVELAGLEFEGELVASGDVPATGVSLSAKRLALDTTQQTLGLEGARAAFAGVTAETDLEGSFGDRLQLAGRISVSQFSPKALAERLGTPLPPTNDPGVFGLASFRGQTEITDDSFAVSDMVARLDDTEFKGRLSVANFEKPAYRFTLTGNRIDLDRYLAPPAEGAPAEADAAALDATEIPVELIRSLDAKGNLKLTEVVLGGLSFTAIELGVTGQGGVLRLHPISARVFDGAYRGDVRIDASGPKPRLSVDENVEGVQLAALGRQVLETEKLSGGLKGRFQLAGRGANLAEIRRDLAGEIGFELSDGAFEGTDVWYQIRRARALLKQQPPPAAPANPRTPFSAVRGTGQVAGGILTNKDLFAELPFLRVTGAGTIDLAAATLDYGVKARVMEKPEFVEGATEEELSEYTEAVIPIRITGALASPSVTPDVEGLLKEQVKGKIEEEKDRLQRRLLERLGVVEEEAPAPAEDGETTSGEQPPEEQSEKESVEDQLKKKLRNLLGD